MPESLLDRPTVYGARAKLGVIVPLTNTTNEVEWNEWAPTGVSVHATRMPLHTDIDSAAGRAALLADIGRHACDLAQARVNVIAYGCTAGSMVSPISALTDHMRQVTDTESVTTAQAIVRALQHLGAKQITVATPYHLDLNAHEKSFLERQGFNVLAMDGLGYGANGVDEYRNIAHIDAPTLSNLVQRVHEQAMQTGTKPEAVLISCTDLPTLDVIEPLEAALKIPVISSNSATMWAALRAAGVTNPVSGVGRLLTT